MYKRQLLDSAVPYGRAALTETARRHRVCPFELGLDLSEWCDVVIGDYNYLFDPVVHLKRFFDTSGAVSYTHLDVYKRQQ